MTNWIKIPNNGQHNYDIFINTEDHSIIMKCDATIKKDVEIINSQVKLFPKQISNYYHDDKPLKLIELNYNYTDLKFDNFGYKLSNLPLEDDYRKNNVPLILYKYFYVFFIDPESGLQPII